MSAKLNFMLFDALGAPDPGLIVQVKDGGGSVVASTAAGTLTDNADGSYTTTSTLAGGAYSVYTGSGAGTVVPSLNPIQHVDEAAVPTSLPVPVTEGGTGATSASAARTALGVAIGSQVQGYNAHLDRWNVVSAAALAGSTDLFLYWNNTGDVWAAVSASSFRTAAGLAIGTNVQAYDPYLTAAAIAFTYWYANDDGGPTLLFLNDGSLGAYSGSAARSALGLGAAATYPITETGDASRVPVITSDSGLVLPTRATHLAATVDNHGKFYRYKTTSEEGLFYIGQTSSAPATYAVIEVESHAISGA